MASKSRVAQEKLVELEKNSAPFEDQLLEAARFVAFDLDDAGRSIAQTEKPGDRSGRPIYHGKEEWLLRWLLKRFQDQKDGTPRASPNSWILFCHLLRVIPLPNAARMLNERRFMVILQQTLEEAKNALRSETAKDKLNKDIDGEVMKGFKRSKKRKRSGELISIKNDSRNHAKRLPAAVFGAIHEMLRHTKITPDIYDGERSTTFSTEYMRSVFQIPSEDASKILGAWLSLCSASLEQPALITRLPAWLSPFIEIWKFCMAGSNDLMHFSLYCSQPLLSLIKDVKSMEVASDWLDELELLLAQNIMIPAKAAKFDDDGSDLLNILTKIFVIQDSANASILFDVAIRSVQVQSTRRRRPSDESWLQTVFITLKDAMPPKRAGENGKAIQEMLQSAVKHNLGIDIPILRSITSQYCLSKSSTNWELLATILRLDVNVLLIPNEEVDLVQQVLSCITAESLEDTWLELSAQVVSEVVIPLMNGFAKARDLSIFIRHWHTQVIEISKVRNAETSLSIPLFGAWEDELLQAKFFNIMEASLTVSQITQLLDWLASQVIEYPDATSVILDAIAGSIGQEDMIDAVGFRLFHIMFDNGVSKNLGEAYKWRSWRMLSRTLKWISEVGLEEISILWEEGLEPFENLSNNFEKGGVLSHIDSDALKLEILRCTCALWDASQKGTILQTLAKEATVLLLRSLSQELQQLLKDLASDKKLGEKMYSSALNTTYQGIGWRLWSSVYSVAVEFSGVLQLGTEVEGSVFRELLQTVFWISSVPRDSSLAKLNPWLRMNPDAYSKVWASLLNNEDVLCNPILMDLIIDIILENATNTANPLINSATTNSFAVQSLLQLPIEVFSRKDRERVIILRLPGAEIGDYGVPIQWSTIDDAVLSLKVKMMQRSTICEGTMYKDLVSLADFLASADIKNSSVSLPCFKELARRTLSHVTANLDQSRNHEYALSALTYLRKKLAIKKLSFALIVLFEVLFEVFAPRATQLNDLGIITQYALLGLQEAFQASIFLQLENIVSKLRISSKSGAQAGRSLTICTIIDVLVKSDIMRGKLASTISGMTPIAAALKDTDMDFPGRLETFTSTFTAASEGNISTVESRQTLIERTYEFIKLKDQPERLSFLHSIFRKEFAWTQLDKLLAVRHIITSCEDSRQISDEGNGMTKDLSSVYSSLCGHLLQAGTFRQFCLIGETMLLMLRTKSRALNQWNIDSTLGVIAMICSRNSPCLRSNRAGSIYLHLCQLFQSLLTSHRLKLEGHFHLVVQTMQSLLRCLFTALRHSTPKTSRIFAPPPWLSSPKHQLGAKHSAAFTRLVTLICDPSVSSVTRSKQNNLTSATDKAKRMASQHMHFVLTLYVRLQLEMKMLPEVREMMVPGLYAIFDTTTPETRRMVSEGLDSSGRAVFGTLFRNYQKFGKWRGS